MIITPFEIAVLPCHAGVSGETPWAVITVWVSTIVVPQIPAKISTIVMVHKTESNHRNILPKRCGSLLCRYKYIYYFFTYCQISYCQISYYQKNML